MERQRKTNLAIEQLGLQVNNKDDSDKYQLGEILVDILAYPTIQEAELHRQANRLGNFDLLSEQTRLIELLNSKNTNQLQLCACCGNIVNQKQIPFLSNLEDIKVGVGVRLYFLSLLYHILIFLIGFFLYSLYSMITNINASKEQIQNLTTLCTYDSQCSTANIGIGSKLMSNQSFKNELAIQSVLGFMYVLIWGIIIVNKNFKQRKLQSELKKDWVSASEFTLMITNFPKGFIEQSNEQVLQNVNEIFQQYQKQIKSKISFQVVKVSIGYPLYKQHLQQKQIREHTEQEMKKKRYLFTDWLAQRRSTDYFQIEQEKRNKLYEEFYQFVTNVYYKSDIKKTDLDDKNIIFVTLRYSKARQVIQNLNKKNSKLWEVCTQQDNTKKIFPIAHVTIQKAPQPDQIKWQNIGFAESLKLVRKILIYLLALILIGISLAITVLLGSVQVGNKVYIISIVISLVITIINWLIELIIIILSLFENQFIKSKEQASIGFKIAISQILNCIAVPIMLTYISNLPIFASGGLVTNVFFISLINMMLPIGRFIDPFNIILKLRQKYYSNPQKRLFDLQGQAQLNKIFTFYEFELGYEYSYIIKTSFFTAFFITLQPIIALFAPVGLTMMFFTNKYRLLYRFNKPNFHSSSVNNMLTFFLKFSLIGFSVGQLYFMNFQAYSIQFNLVINWVSVGFSILFVFFPLSVCRKLFDQIHNTCMDYRQKLLYLTSDYDRMNPITKQDAIDQFRQYLQQYEKKCHLPLPQKSQMIKMSLIEMKKHNPVSMIQFNKEKTKIVMHNRDLLGSDLHTAQRLR